MSEVPRIIFDTNVIVSAMRSRRGASAALLAMVGAGEFEINLSVALALEYEEVLLREGLVTAEEATELVDFLCANAIRREISRRTRPLLDDPDDEFLAELALSFSCDYLVTHNVHHLRALAGQGVQIVTPGRFLAIIRQSRDPTHRSNP